ncbi:putative glycosyltransferase [Gigaspora margarita]|uniref:Putative glycosyltransferase n=1 Tax=Gigaspora margarita TaxID=4874 RepID=A0A8H4ATY6_GIGMA|nr:putative glycosyltransferase [Gigaspora margarita]
MGTQFTFTSTSVMSNLDPTITSVKKSQFYFKILADNARVYTIVSDQSFFGFLDLIYVFAFAAIAGLTNRTPISYGMCITLLIIWLWTKFNIVKQVETVYINGRTVSRFIERSKISDIIINEGITMLQVKFYMAIIVEGQDRMVVVFQHLLPKYSILIQVYRGTRSIIFNESEESVENTEGFQSI